MYSFYSGLYIDEAVSDAEAVKDMLARQTGVFNVYLLCVRPDGGGIAEIFRSDRLFSHPYSGRRYMIIGMADGKYGAFRLFERVARDFAASGREWEQFREFFLSEFLDEGCDRHER